MNANIDLMGKFLKDRKKLKPYSRLKYITDVPRPYLLIDQPEILAAFAGYLKFQCFKRGSNLKVFCRGQIGDHSSIPSLFRGENLSNDRLKRRLVAYDSLINKSKILFKASRFQSENIHPIFQHYGLKTPWLDLVDNIFVALWFATMKNFIGKNRNKTYYRESTEKFGHIYFYIVPERKPPLP